MGNTTANSGAHLESIWEYPVIPRVEAFPGHIQVLAGGILVADSNRALRIVERGHAPVYYLPPDDVRMDLLALTNHQTRCEWKGHARYYDLHLGDQWISEAAWTYLEPAPDFHSIGRYVAFYPQRVEVCLVDGERAAPEPGQYFGGWITQSIQGPFLGEGG